MLTNDLDWMRDTLLGVLPSTCYILTSTDVANGAGEVTQTWGTADTQPCRIDPIKGAVQQGYQQPAGAGVAAFQRCMLTLPHDATISANNRVKINDVTYNVTGVSPRDAWSLDTRVEVEKI